MSEPSLSPSLSPIPKRPERRLAMVMTRSSIKRAKTIWELRVAIHHVTFKQPRDDGKAQGIDVCGSA
ncbi:hypothetical protein Bpfe_030300, partial [Biomphalaria pfeifferi]